MIALVIERAAEIADQFGIDVEEALSRWAQAGCANGGEDAGTWLSVAFLLARQDRNAILYGVA